MLDGSELSSVVGYIAIASTFVAGEVDGEYGELIKLDNGMIFEIDEDCPMFETIPEIVIFQMIITPAEAKERLNKEWSEPVFLYKLVIGGRIG